MRVKLEVILDSDDDEETKDWMVADLVEYVRAYKIEPEHPVVKSVTVLIDGTDRFTWEPGDVQQLR